MGLDPVSIAITAVLLWHLLTGAPGVLADLASDIAAALRERSLRAAFREQVARMRKAGAAPSRSYLRNVWRASAVAANRRRQDRRAARPAGERDRGWRGRADRAMAAMVDRWRRANPPPRPPRGPVRASATVDRPAGGAAPPVVALPAGPASTEGAWAPPPQPSGGATTWVLPTARRGDEAPPAPAVEGPVRATAEVGRPADASTTSGTAVAVLDAPPHRQIEGAPTVSAAGAVEVTGVVSGSMEAASIAAAVEQANAAYLAAMAAVRARIASLAEQTDANVEMKGSGEVQTWLAAAAEAAAVAEAAASKCGSEVGPLMYGVKNAFDRRNS